MTGAPIRALRFTGPAEGSTQALDRLLAVPTWRFARTSNIAATGGTPPLFESMSNPGPGQMVMVLPDWWKDGDTRRFGVAHIEIPLSEDRYKDVIAYLVDRSVTYLAKPLTLPDLPTANAEPIGT